MLEDLTNVDLIDHVLANMDEATEAEAVLVDRLHHALYEIERLVQEIQRLEALNGSDT